MVTVSREVLNMTLNVSTNIMFSEVKLLLNIDNRIFYTPQKVRNPQLQLKVFLIVGYPMI